MKQFSEYPAWVRAVLVPLGILAAVAWYGYGFSGVGHSSNGKGKGGSQSSYAAHRAMIQALAIDPTALYPVARVIDGDTFVVTIQGKEITVRVLGMDTPETVKPHTPVQCYGPEASAEDKDLLIGHSVRLAIDPAEDKVDFYGRLLAYVHRDDGLFLEEHMIQEGFAREYTFDPKRPYQYQSDFKALQATAQAAHAGLWGKCKM